MILTRRFGATAKCLAAACGIVLLSASTAQASSISYSGLFLTSDETFTTAFTLGAASDVTIQSWGFGGDGALIPAGGFDSLLALFAGTGPSATILLDLVGEPIVSADIFWGFEGTCPNGNTDTIGGNPVCGDASLYVPNLGPGTYTLLLTHAPYTPLAVYGGTTLGDGFIDFTGGVFQTLETVSGVYSDRTGNWAVDIAMNEVNPTAVPEPATLVLFGSGLLAVARWKRKA